MLMLHLLFSRFLLKGLPNVKVWRHLVATWSQYTLLTWKVSGLMATTGIIAASVRDSRLCI